MMTQTNKTVCILGGSGFIGRYVCQDLARAGYRIKIATRIPESVYALKPYGNVGQVVAVQCNYNDQESLSHVIDGCDAVVNLVGILFEKRKSKFVSVHSELPKMIAEICVEKKIQNFIHISALGVDKGISKYAKSKLAGEQAVQEVMPSAVIMHPSVVFGPGDSFFNMFAKMAIFLPFLPLIGGGKTKLQPVYVGDVSQAITKIMTQGVSNHAGKIYQLAGPEIVTFKEVYEILLSEINRKKRFVKLPWMVAKIQGVFLSLMPKPLLTCDQVRSLQTDSVMGGDAQGLKNLNITPTAIKTILPRYLNNFKKGGPFAYKKGNAKKTA